jgi:hypothetical protein
MNSTYAQKSSTVQKAADTKAASVLDSSAQSESLQRKADMANNATQRAEAPRPNNTGMPDNLKSGIESLSGFSMDDVRVHYNSSKPATVQALAYTQGTDIHVAPGQEKHLPHEAWHVAQQMAGRVSPTTNINGMPVNDNAALEHEADVMGEKAVQLKNVNCKKLIKNNINNSQKIVQNITMKNHSGKEKNDIDTVQNLYDLINEYRNAVNVYNTRLEQYNIALKNCRNPRSKPSKPKCPEFPSYKGEPLNNEDIKFVQEKYDDNVKDCRIEKDPSKEDATNIVPENKQKLLEIIKNIYEKSFKSNDAQILKKCIIDSKNNLTELSKSAMNEGICLGKKSDTFKQFINELQKNDCEILKKYVSLNLKNHNDLMHQLAQDFSLFSLGEKEKKMIGIHHQFNDFIYNDEEIASSSKDDSVSHNQKMRVYRSMTLDDFLNVKAKGHGSCLGMALEYNGVTVEFDFGESEIPLKKVGTQGEGTQTKENGMGRKSEGQSKLPQINHDKIYSVDLSSASFMQKYNPKMRVVFDTLDLEKIDVSKRVVYEYMKENVHSYSSWETYKDLSKNVTDRVEIAKKMLMLGRSTKDVMRISNFGNDIIEEINKSIPHTK